MFRAAIFISLLLQVQTALPQDILRGYIFTEQQEPLVNASIQSQSNSSFTYSNSKGYFELDTESLKQIQIEIRFLGYVSVDTSFKLPQQQAIVIQLKPDANTLEEVRVVESEVTADQKEAPNVVSIELNDMDLVTSANMDFNQILKTLPGVSSNNELSSSYQVRGGNFDENLVYVNDIPVYRPFLANTGRQEGLSFVNPSLVENIAFYAGGWESKYGDKLSSSLNITYKEPDQLEGNVVGSLLGGSLYLGNRANNDRISYLVAGRYRDTQYLLNSLEVEGAYFPRFTDVQSLITADLTKKSLSQRNKTKLYWLNSYSRNRYLTLPTSQVTEFGSVVTNLRIQTAFAGRETLAYDTYQTGINLNHIWSERLASQFVASAVVTQEQENFEVEGAYRLCDIDNNPSSASFDDCVITRGIGSQYDFGRNSLNANLIYLENRNTWLLDEYNVLEIGAGVSTTFIKDSINEFSFQDSALFVDFTEVIFNEVDLTYENYFGYVQYTHFNEDSTHRLHLGTRINYWTPNNKILFSPRFNYTFQPKKENAARYTFSVGLYQQFPFYRELRDFSGSINTKVDAQRSLHIIAGIEKTLEMWGRPFLLSSQVYYKSITNLIPYDIENMRLRYYTDLDAIGFATGVDVRLNGEFVPGTQSWFSFSLLNTQEKLLDYDFGWQRRPTDQRVQVGVYFEDHLPDDPTWRVYLNLQFGSGFAFGPPGDLALRGKFQGDEYYRADLGLSKRISFQQFFFNQGTIRLEVLNAFGADNTLSYTWIKDVTGASFAIPNSLTARLINLKLSLSL